ncbi:unnamed protein product [Owenia fusiformis]|uniref:Uncharacterized protein n=1 Tax=Owenia fusiformis TaxID=6347 RepID=A0A8J1TRW1_OWEFU|nr:unnamed protein product [Owenia fusiformis]
MLNMNTLTPFAFLLLLGLVFGHGKPDADTEKEPVMTKEEIKSLRQALKEAREKPQVPYVLKELTIPETFENGEKPKIFTDEELAKHDGSNPDLPILLACKGEVFDVTEGKDFYGPGNAYNALTGKDASRAIAMMSIDEDEMTPDLSGLTNAQLEMLDIFWEGTYKSKYPSVGFTQRLYDEIQQKKKDEL